MDGFTEYLIDPMLVPYLTVTTGICGLLLIIVCVVCVFSAQHRLRRFRSSDEGVADLLNYATMVEDGIVQNKDGSFLVAYLSRAADGARATSAGREMWSRRLNEAFRPLGSGWLLHVDSFREACPSYSPRNSSHFPDPVSLAMDEERRLYFEKGGMLYEGYNVISITWFPPKLAEQKFTALMYSDTQKEKRSANTADRLLDEFKRELMNIESRLSSVFTLSRLRSYTVETETGVVCYDGLLQWLNFCVTGINHPVFLPKTPVGLDYLIGGKDLIAGVTPMIGENYIQSVSFINFPAESTPGMLNILTQLPCEYRWSSRYIALDQHEALARMEKGRKKWKQKERGIIDVLLQNMNGRVNTDAVEMVASVEEMMRENHSGIISSGYYTVTVVLMHHEHARVMESAQYLAKVAGELGFGTQIETINNLEAYLGSLPGHGIPNIRSAIINTMNFADLIPSSSIWTGEDKCPCDFYPEGSPSLMHTVTSGYSPFRLNLHVRDLGHTIIFGPTGAGKSVLLATLAAQFLRYSGMTIFSFDKGMSIYTLCKAVGGQHYEIGGSETYVNDHGEAVTRASYAFCPLQYIDSAADITWATEWLVMCLALNGLKVDAGHRKEIVSTLQVMVGSESKNRSLDAFHTQVSDAEVKKYLQPYTLDGQYGYMLGAREDELDFSARGGLCVFEIEELMSMQDPRLALPVLLYLFRRIEKNLTGQPAAIFLDEAWLMLSHDTFRAKIREWFKVLRKANCSIVMATQSLSDATNSGILDVIKESTATKIYLPNPVARNEDTAEVYMRMGLNSQQIRALSEAIPKRQYYYVSEYGSRMFELALEELQLAILAVSDKDSILRVKELLARYGDKWLGWWLREKRVSEKKIRLLEAALEAKVAKEESGI